eukprot:tig00000681_g3125.t1
MDPVPPLVRAQCEVAYARLKAAGFTAENSHLVGVLMKVLEGGFRLDSNKVRVFAKNVLGTGSFGKVVLGTYQGQEVAVKQAKPPERQAGRGAGSVAPAAASSYNSVAPAVGIDVVRELCVPLAAHAAALDRGDAAPIMRVLGYTTFGADPSPAIVMERLYGTLHDLRPTENDGKPRQGARRLSEEELKRIVLQLVEGCRLLGAAHGDGGIRHCDLKTMNIGLRRSASTMTPVLIDFGDVWIRGINGEHSTDYATTLVNPECMFYPDGRPTYGHSAPDCQCDEARLVYQIAAIVLGLTLPAGVPLWEPTDIHPDGRIAGVSPTCSLTMAMLFGIRLSPPSLGMGQQDPSKCTRGEASPALQKFLYDFLMYTSDRGRTRTLRAMENHPWIRSGSTAAGDPRATARTVAPQGLERSTSRRPVAARPVGPVEMSRRPSPTTPAASFRIPFASGVGRLFGAGGRTRDYVKEPVTAKDCMGWWRLVSEAPGVRGTPIGNALAQLGQGSLYVNPGSIRIDFNQELGRGKNAQVCVAEYGPRRVAVKLPYDPEAGARDAIFELAGAMAAFNALIRIEDADLAAGKPWARELIGGGGSRRAAPALPNTLGWTLERPSRIGWGANNQGRGAPAPCVISELLQLAPGRRPGDDQEGADLKKEMDAIKGGRVRVEHGNLVFFALAAVLRLIPAVRALHLAGFTHCDLKLENVGIRPLPPRPGQYAPLNINENPLEAARRLVLLDFGGGALKNASGGGGDSKLPGRLRGALDPGSEPPTRGAFLPHECVAEEIAKANTAGGAGAGAHLEHVPDRPRTPCMRCDEEFDVIGLASLAADIIARGQTMYGQGQTAVHCRVRADHLRPLASASNSLMPPDHCMDRLGGGPGALEDANIRHFLRRRPGRPWTLDDLEAALGRVYMGYSMGAPPAPAPAPPLLRPPAGRGPAPPAQRPPAPPAPVAAWRAEPQPVPPGPPSPAAWRAEPPPPPPLRPPPPVAAWRPEPEGAFASVVAPVTPRVPPNVVFPVTPSVPPTEVPASVVAPVTPSVPPTEAFARVVAPVTPRVPPNVVFPVTPSAPPTDVPASVVAPVTPSVPPTEAFARVVAPVTPRVPPNVVAPVTPRVLSVVFPVTPSVPPTEAFARVVAPVTPRVPPNGYQRLLDRGGGGGGRGGDGPVNPYSAGDPAYWAYHYGVVLFQETAAPIVNYYASSHSRLGGRLLRLQMPSESTTGSQL